MYLIQETTFPDHIIKLAGVNMAWETGRYRITIIKPNHRGITEEVIRTKSRYLRFEKEN